MGDKNELKEFNISNKFLYTVVALIVIITLGVNVYASGGTHTMGELTAPCTNGIITSSSGAWGCIASPATCTGANEVLHWDGSSWSCATIGGSSAPILECNWFGWSAGCICLTASPGYTCGTVNGINIYAQPKIQEDCSNGVIVDRREIYCCDFIGGSCDAY